MRHLALALMLLLPTLCHAGPGWVALTDLGPEARSTWPNLTRLVDEAKRLGQGAGRLPNPVDFARARYSGAPNQEQARADRDSLIEALDALRVLERSASARKEDPAFYRAFQTQLVHLINRTIRAEAKRRERLPRLLAPRPELSHAEAFARIRSRPDAPYAMVAPAVELIMTLAQSVRGGCPKGPLGEGRLGRTLAQAGRATLYRIEGRTAFGRYTGWATLEETAEGLVLTTQRGNQAPMRARLIRAAESWVWRSPFVPKRGAASRVEGEEVDEQEAQVELRPGNKPGELYLRWRIVKGEGAEVVASGKETLCRELGRRDAEAQTLMSPLMAKIVAACRPVTGRGTVPAGSLVSTATRIHPALIEGPAIFNEAASMIREAKREVLLQVFVWEVESEASKKVEQA